MLTMFPVSISKIGNKTKKTPAVPKGTDWRTYRGWQPDGGNYGIVVPDGVVVFDIDIHKGVTKDVIDDALGCQMPWNTALLQTTISGGEHYAFRCEFDIPQSSNLLGVIGFDTRCAGKGWICSGEGYHGKAQERLDDIQSLPNLPAQAVMKLRSPTKKEDSWDLDDIIDNQPVDWTKDQIRTAVMSMPVVEDYHAWLEIGMALHHQANGETWGGKIWNQYSKQCSNYDKSEIVQKWHSFGKSTAKSVTFKTLIHRYNLTKNPEVRQELDSQPTKPERLITISLDLLNKEPEKRELIADRFPIGCTSAVVAMGGVGKTTWLVKQSIDLASEGISTLFVSSEDGPDDYQSKIYNAVRAEDKAYDLQEIADKLHVLDLRGVGTKLVNEDRGSYRPSETVAKISAVAKQVNASLVVFETLSRFAGGEENERFEAVVTACDAIANDFGGAVVLVHHTGKSQARDKVIDLYSGRGGSVLGDNTRSMTVITRLDEDYQGSESVLIENEDLLAGRGFEVSHVRCSYSGVCPPEYYLTKGGLNGPYLEQLRIGTEEEIRKVVLNRLAKQENDIALRVIDVIKGEGTVDRKFFESETKAKIGCSQKQGRAVVDRLIEDGLIYVDHVSTRGGQKKKIMKVCDTPLTHLDTP